MKDKIKFSSARLYNTSDGLRFSASSLMSNAILVWLASALLTFILQGIIGLSGSNVGLFGNILLIISPAANFIATLMVYSSLKREQQANTIHNSQSNDKFIDVLSRLVICFLIATILISVFYLLLNAYLGTADKYELSDADRLGLAKTYIQLKLLSNLCAKFFAIPNIIALFAIKFYISDSEDADIKKFALAAILITFGSLLLIVINYVAALISTKDIAVLQNTNITQSIFGKIANLTGYAPYISQYLLFEARKNKLSKLLSAE